MIELTTLKEQRTGFIFPTNITEYELKLKRLLQKINSSPKNKLEANSNKVKFSQIKEIRSKIQFKEIGPPEDVNL